jgi:hypothetical protein
VVWPLQRASVRPLSQRPSVAVPLRFDETALIGTWLDTRAGMVEDEVTKRISSQVADSLVKVGTDLSGWATTLATSVCGS